MATTYRKRYNLVSGTLGAALTTGSTSITFASALKEGGSGGSNIATLGTDEYLVLKIEDELVYLTVYTAGGTSGTVVRAREGSVDPGIDHPNGAGVKHVGTKFDVGAVSALTTLTDTQPNSTSAVQWGTEEAVIAQALCAPGMAVIANLAGAMRPGTSPSVGDKGSFKLQCSFDGGSSWTDMHTTITASIWTTDTTWGLPISATGRLVGTVTGSIQVRAMVNDGTTANHVKFLSGVIAATAHPATA